MAVWGALEILLKQSSMRSCKHSHVSQVEWMHRENHYKDALRSLPAAKQLWQM